MDRNGLDFNPKSDEARRRIIAAQSQSGSRDPEHLRSMGQKGGRVTGYRRRPLPVWCSWCGRTLMRHQCTLRKQNGFTCLEHRSYYLAWRRWHPNEPRPLILERLRSGETGIGESQIERDALAMEQVQPVVPRPIPTPKPASVPEKPVQRRQKPIIAQEVGPLGEALLKAVKQKGNDHGTVRATGAAGPFDRVDPAGAG